MASILGLLGAGLSVAGFTVARSGRRLVGVPILLLGVAVLAAGVLLLIFVSVYRIPSPAMAPTLAVKDRIAVLKSADVARGDLVVFHPPAAALDGGCGRPVSESQLCPRAGGGRAEVTFVKRVVAVGGDRIGVRNGRAVVNGREVDEPYIRACGTGSGCDFRREIMIPGGQFYMLGDNRGQSDDSRFWGPVPEDWLVGRVVFRYWPLTRVGAP